MFLRGKVKLNGHFWCFFIVVNRKNSLPRLQLRLGNRLRNCHDYTSLVVCHSTSKKGSNFVKITLKPKMSHFEKCLFIGILMANNILKTPFEHNFIKKKETG